jgi:hypothetical protein
LDGDGGRHDSHLARSMTPVNPPGIGISPIADVGMRQRVGRLSISQTMES